MKQNFEKEYVSVTRKILLMGALVTLLTFVYDRVFGLLHIENTSLFWILGTIDYYLLAPILTFLFSFYASKKYKNLIESHALKFKPLTAGVGIFLSYLVTYNLVTIIISRSLSFSFPYPVTVITAILGSYLGWKSNKKTA